jgi:hypothetical protein
MLSLSFVPAWKERKTVKDEVTSYGKYLRPAHGGMSPIMFAEWSEAVQVSGLRGPVPWELQLLAEARCAKSWT